MAKSDRYDFLITYLAQFTGAIVGVLVIKIFAHYLTQEQFGALLSSRRVVGMVIPLLTLNLSLSLAKYNSTNSEIRRELLSITLFSSLLMWGILGIISIFYIDQLTVFIFNQLEYKVFTWTILLYLFAASVHMLLTGYWRGLRKFKVMNVLTTLFHLSHLILLVTLFLLLDENIKILNRYYLMLAGVTILINVLILLFLERSTGRDPFLKIHRIRENLKVVKDFLYYGYSRLPGGIFYAVIFMLPVLTATKYLSLASAANVGIVISVANLVFLFGFPINLIVLPQYAKHHAEDSPIQLKQRIQGMVNISFTYPFVVAPALYLFAKEVVIILFDAKYGLAAFYLKIFSTVAGLFLAYISLRGILDGIKKYPYANYVTGIGIVIILISTAVFLRGGIEEAEIVKSFCLAIAAMYVTNLIIIRNNFGISVLNMHNIISILWFILSMFLIHFYNMNAPVIENLWVGLGVKAAIFSLFGLSSLILFNHLKKQGLRHQ